MNRNELIDVLTAIAAVDNRSVGESTITMWGAIIGDLPKDLALQAVIDHRREEPGTYLEPGHVYQRCRAARRDMLEREPDEIREARQEQLAAKVAQDAAELAAAKTIPPVRFIRPSANPAAAPWLQVKCPYPPCRAPIGQRCTNSATKKQLQAPAHPMRIAAAASGHEHHTALPLCTACHTRPLVTDEDTTQGVCKHCRQAATPQQPKTKVREGNPA